MTNTEKALNFAHTTPLAGLLTVDGKITGALTSRLWRALDRPSDGMSVDLLIKVEQVIINRVSHLLS